MKFIGKAKFKVGALAAQGDVFEVSPPYALAVLKGMSLRPLLKVEGEKAEVIGWAKGTLNAKIVIAALKHGQDVDEILKTYWGNSAEELYALYEEGEE